MIQTGLDVQLQKKKIIEWIIQLDNYFFPWKSKKQDVISCPSAEAEYQRMLFSNRPSQTLLIFVLQLKRVLRDTSSVSFYLQF